MVLNQTEHGWLAGRYREQAHSYNWMVLNQTEHGWLAGRYREQAHSYNWIVYIRAETGRLSGRLREQALLLQKQDQKIAAFGSSYMKSNPRHH
jgi:hypothetical protein